MTDTVQRINDLLAVADDKEVKLLATIVRDHILQEKKTTMGFNPDDEPKQEQKND